MRRMIKIIYASFLIFMLSAALVSAQDKKTEQKIKVIVEDGSGTKVIIDTVYKDTPAPDSIKLKDGTVIFTKHEGDGADTRHNKGKKNYFVTYSTDGTNEGKEAHEVTVISTDSIRSNKGGDSNDVIYYTNSDKSRGGEKVEVIMKGSKDDGDNDSLADKTRIVIAKDGMVVTIEGNDEAKAQELAKEVENKLGINSEGSEKKETVKVESKKTIKK